MCCWDLPHFDTILVRDRSYLKRHLNATDLHRILRLTLGHGDHICISAELTTIRAFALDMAAVCHILVEVGAGQEPQPAQVVPHLSDLTDLTD